MRSAIRILLGHLLLLAACDNAVPKCTPGTTQSCACTDGHQGAQSCTNDGTFAECKCSPPSSDSQQVKDDATPTQTDREADGEKGVRALLDEWLKAQNEGNFEAYEALYAREATGVRLSGTTKRHFNRAGWLKDRARMFKGKMHVGIEGAIFKVADTYGRISIVQTFQSGRYRDVGGKQIVAVREDGKWAIQREDMISSDYKPDNACDPEKHEWCTGDAEFYANEDWDAYSDNEGGASYFRDELKRRYQSDIDRCVRKHFVQGQSLEGTIAAMVVPGGQTNGAKVNGFSKSINDCIEDIANSTWLFADPQTSALNDYSPKSLRNGVVAFRLPIKSDL
jgi:hypothetical protein